jgi:uncharacterized membrane protein YcaP (DUF421 family)
MFFEALTPDIVARGIVLPAVALTWIISLVRLVGLRSFSKMTNFDFVTTVAQGSLLAGASQASSWSAFAQALFAMAALFAVQYALALARQSSNKVESTLQNRPVMLMENGEILEDALAECRVAKDDLFAKLREANVLRMADVRAAILETTGDVSILHGDRISDEILRGVTKAAR